MMEDWVECSLAEICKINMGQSPPSSTYNTEGNGLPFFQGKAEFTELYPIPRKWCDSPKKVAEKGDILMSVRAPVGDTNIANEKCAIGRGLAAISYSQCRNFLWFYLKHIKSSLSAKGTGTTFKAISGKILRNQTIPLPPLPIQRAIVARIEELFSSLDQGVADLRRAQEQLRVYRQAVLKKAFEGELTREWREIYLNQTNLGLRESNLAENEPNGKIPSDWELKKLSELFKKSPQNGLYKPKSKYGKGTAIIRIDNFYNGKINSFSTFQRVQLEKEEIAKYSLEPGDLIVNRVNSIEYLGKTGLVKDYPEAVVFESNIMKLVIDKNQISSHYLNHFLNSVGGRAQLLQNAKHAVNQASINQKDVSNVFVPLCSLKEQYQIVQEIESRLSICDQVEANIQESLAKAEALRQSILKKAFEGKLLTAADIAACKEEADYEPAAVLLARMKVEQKK